MIDLHSHILYGVDDGSKTIEESINMAKEAEKAGFTTICCSSHYMEPHYISKKNENKELIKVLKEKLIKEEININLVISNEIYVSADIIEFIDSNKVSKIGESDYILIEFPMNQELRYVKDIINQLVSSGNKIIIAHPERYSYVQKNINYLEQFLEMGVIFQCNYASILGYYGNNAKKTFIKLLKRKMVQILATDSHKDNSIYTKMYEINKKIKKYIDDDFFEVLTVENPKRILKNEDPIIFEFEKKNILKFWK